MKKIILLLFIGLTGILNAQDIELAVGYVEQEETYWCSAASAKCVLDYKGINKSQCNIMEYVRTNSNGYGSLSCCFKPVTVCNNGVPLGIDNEKGSVKGVLWNFGNLPSKGFWNSLWITSIEDNLKLKRPVIIQLDYNNNPDAHAVVIYGIEKEKSDDYVYYMDPGPLPPVGTGGKQRLTWNTLLYNAMWWWRGTLEIKGCLLERDLPCHCYNLEHDVGVENGVDCGGSCEPCPTLPPPPPPPDPTKCSNCEWDPGEAVIDNQWVPDCGGACPPCADLPEEIIINDKIYEYYEYYKYEVMAKNNITAGNNVTVKSGAKVSFNVDEAGSITLLPGFKAVKGSNVSASTKDLSKYSRKCPDTLCSCAKVDGTVYSCLGYNHYSYLSIYFLLYAVKIEFEIYNETGEFIYGGVQKITRNGLFYLWHSPCGTKGVYWLYCTIYYCNGMTSFILHRFFVNDEYSPKDFSPPDNPDAPETQLSPPVNSIINQNESTVPIFSIIPNPNGGTFQLETNFPLTVIESLKITNTLGVPVYESQNITSPTIQLTGLASGQYFVVVLLKDGTVLTQKLMLQR